VSESNLKPESCRYILCNHFSSQFWFWLYEAPAETGLETDFVSYSGTIAAFSYGGQGSYLLAPVLFGGLLVLVLMNQIVRYMGEI
jgi:hypothetical protein